VGFAPFALFVGIALSVTAFPVLARILTDWGMQRTRLGIFALGCAASVDVTAWCLLAFVVGVAKATVGGALVTLGLTAAYIALMFLVVRPIALCFLARYENSSLPRGMVAMVFGGVILSALATETIGIHALFGAFLFGAVIPHDSPLARTFLKRLEDLVTVLLLPAFFAYTGMRTRIGLLAGLENWLICGLIVVVATVGKFGGTLFSARLIGFRWRDAAALGLLMNTRGLMELIVLNIGLDLKVISPPLFAMMVLMALATTMATAPLLQLLPKSQERAEGSYE
jgi:Kef-type K+ transport system membrane component KefB